MAQLATGFMGVVRHIGQVEPRVQFERMCLRAKAEEKKQILRAGLVLPRVKFVLQL